MGTVVLGITIVRLLKMMYPAQIFGERRHFFMLPVGLEAELGDVVCFRVKRRRVGTTRRFLYRVTWRRRHIVRRSCVVFIERREWIGSAIGHGVYLSPCWQGIIRLIKDGNGWGCTVI
jgi:hypothetical protein